VYVGDTATFKKEDSVTSGNSGIIYGDDDTTHTLDSDENTAVNYGHAVYVQNGGKKRDNTAGAAVNLDSADSAGTNNWD
jgi:hypothetical protein